MKNKHLSILYLVVFIDMVGFGIIIPLLPYLVGELGASGLFAASLLSIYSLMQFIFSPIWGKISDRIGRKIIINTCLLGSFLSYALYAAAFFITSDKYIILALIFTSRLIAGVMGANISIAYSYISDTLDASERTAAMGKVGAALGMGFILGPAIASVLAPYGLAAPGVGAMLICLFGFIFSLSFLREKESKQSNNIQKSESRASSWGVVSILKKKFFYIVLVSFTYSFAFVQMESIFSLFIGSKYSLSSSQISLLFLYVGVIIAISQGALVGPACKILGNYKLLITGSALLAFSFLFLATSNSVFYMIVFTTGVSLSAGAINPAISALIANNASPNHQGLAQGINQSAASLSRIIGPIVAGLLYDSYSFNSPFFLGATLMIFVLLFLLIFRINDRASTAIDKAEVESFA